MPLQPPRAALRFVELPICVRSCPTASHNPYCTTNIPAQRARQTRPHTHSHLRQHQPFLRPVNNTDSHQRSPPSRTLSTTRPHLHPTKPNASQTNPHHPASTPDRGPTSTEDTQTDFAALNVLGNTTSPTTAVDTCLDDGFMFDSGLRVGDGDGVVLVGGQGFVWRPWMAGTGVAEGRVVTGLDVRGRGKNGKGEGKGTGGVVNGRGQFEVGEAAWGLLRAVWPKPGTGAQIRPLAPPTRLFLQSLGLRIEVVDTRNAASQFNLLATERGTSEVAAVLVPVGFGR